MTPPDSLPASENPHRTAYLAVRRALRLGRFVDASAIFAAENNDPAECRASLMLAAEEACIPEDQADTIVWRAMRDPFDMDADGDCPPVQSAERVKIHADPSTLTAQISAAEAALIRGNLNLFQRGGALVRLGWTDDGDGEVMRAVPVDEAHLAELIGRVTTWTKQDARARGYVPTGVPREIAQAYLARGGLEWRLPRLTAIIEAATLRADGSILAQPGHDAETGLFFAPGKAHAFPTWQSRSAASDAADTLLELLDGFPFVDEADLSVALAAILTASIRRALPTAPLFAFTAPAPGTGKSMLADVVAMISTGQQAKALSWTGDVQEDRKALDSALLEGAPIVSFDNITAPLGGDRLNQMLSQGAATVRVLGQSKNVEVTCGALMLANGNNLALAADLTRRTMLCRLDAKVERPELREFASNPLEMIRRDRGRYLTAALTILRAYRAAGRPNRPKPLGSFEGWSDWVRAALLWLNFADPVATQENAREVDPRGAELAAVLGQWNENIGDRRVTSAEVIRSATQSVEFREALLAVAGRAGAINTHVLATWMHANKGRLVSGLHLEHAGKARGGYATWILEGGRASAEVVSLRGCEFSDAAD